MKKKTFNNFLLYFILFFPFMKPDYINLIPRLSYIFNFWKFASITISIIILIIKRKMSRSLLLIILLNAILLGSTIINNGDIVNNMLFSGSMIALAIMFEHGMNNKKDFFGTLMFCFEIVIYLNFISIILLPGGLYTTGSALTGMATENWLLGFKNTHIAHFLPAFIIAYINFKKYNRKFRSSFLITIILLSSVICKSGTTIMGMFILAVIAFFPTLKKHYNILNFRNYVFIFIFLFLFIIIFRLQESFSFIIVDILHKDLTFTNRTRIWDITLNYIVLKPLLGYGMQTNDFRHYMYNSQSAIHAHNQFLENLFVGGIIYVLMYIIIFIYIHKKTNKYKDNEIIQMTSAGIFVWFILGLTEAYLNPLMYLVILIMIYASSFIENKEGDKECQNI